jgi:hypothetical protein
MARDKTSNALDWKFHDMPQAMRNRWLAWANSHNWGAGESRFTENLETGRIELHVETAFNDECGDWGVESSLVKSPRELRNWAGY